MLAAIIATATAIKRVVRSNHMRCNPIDAGLGCNEIEKINTLNLLGIIDHDLRAIGGHRYDSRYLRLELHQPNALDEFYPLMFVAYYNAIHAVLYGVTLDGKIDAICF